MSVIEFFIEYWDWYLLIGAIFWIAAGLNSEFQGWKELFVFPVSILVWPIAIAQAVLSLKR